jgi:hypothetical protein
MPQISPQTLQLLIPLIIIIPVFLLRARRLSRPQPLKLWLLWLRPAILLVVCAVVLLLPQPGVAPRVFLPTDWAVLALAAALGAVGGWYVGKTMAIEVHPENGALMVKGGPLGLLVIAGLLVARTLLRSGARMEASAWHLDVTLIFDALIVFTAGLYAVRSLEMYLRAKRVMAGRGAA